MNMIRFQAIETKNAQELRGGGPDAYGGQPEVLRSDGAGYPCRHCLSNIEAGQDVLLLAYRPFSTLHAYAETGPIFLHAGNCERFEANATPPSILSESPDYILRGYDGQDRIVYATGSVTKREEISDYASRLLQRDDVAYVHIRSARNNCFLCRVERAGHGEQRPGHQKPGLRAIQATARSFSAGWAS